MNGKQRNSLSFIRWRRGRVSKFGFRVCIGALFLLTAAGVYAQPSQTTTDAEPLASALSAQSWQQVEQSIDRALAWLARQQDRDGSFEAPDNAQPAATSLAVMAFLSRGHLPGAGPYGAQIDKAIDYVLECQAANGLLANAPGSGRTDGKTGNYNHGVAGLMLTEVYGLTDRTRAARIKPAILKALQFTRGIQSSPKSHAAEHGGWRYLSSYGANESDLSVTSWQLMFLRSAKNAEFDVPKEQIDEAVAYVLRCWNDRQGLFYYRRAGDSRWSRGMVGAGILSLALAGQHETAVAQRAGDWLLSQPFRSYGEQVGGGDRFFYSTYYCSQAMAQLGGRYFKQFFPSIVNVLLRSQQSSGEWPAEPYGGDRVFGNACTTAMAVLSLTPPLQLLPVYQR
jgi:squalene cyclase